MSGGFVRYTVASWRKHSWTTTVGGSATAAAAAAFLLLSRDDSWERSTAERKVAQAEPLLFYGQHHHADAVLADRPRFVGQFSPPPAVAGKQQQQQQQTKEQVATTATATAGMKPQHTVR
jgi:hypothetical protein